MAFLPSLRQALADYAWLLTRGYTENASLKLCGDRYRLNQRQRMAVHRAVCTDEQLKVRTAKAVSLETWRGAHLEIDGFNLLITIEAALSGAYLFLGRDGCIRDIASVHGSYRKVEETLPAITSIGKFLMEEAGVASAKWYFDSPVSNSGRLKTILLEIATEQGWNWEAEVVKNPDTILAVSPEIIVTSDSWILDECQQWAEVAREVIRTLPEARVVDMESKD